MEEAHLKTLLEKYEEDLKRIDLPEKYKRRSLSFLGEWLEKEEFNDYLAQVEYMIKQEYTYELLDCFYQVIPFGTGGRRGKVGLGPNRINKWTIQSSAQGHSQYFLKHHGEEAKEKGVVLAYDVREFQYEPHYSKELPNPLEEVNCKNLALAAAEVYTANGFKVYMFTQPTPVGELSFAIRELGAVGGAMFSASHNPPTDNGKKVFDSNGGQLIPPYDEELVNEVTSNVKDIEHISLEEAEDKGLIEEIGEVLHEKYLESVVKQSLSNNRSAKILYSPLHGTGRNSIYDVLKKAGFEVELDEKTSNFSGKFENVVFNIPNPEVEQSFKTLLESDKADSVDLLINSDPDADRLGLMARDSVEEWRYFNGNEIGILLTNYILSKKEGELSNDNLVVETCVTSSLISKIASEYGVSKVDDLLVGFKYIADIMNRFEEEGKSDKFLLGAEESHGYIAGNYARDKDGAVGALLLSELASELKDKGSNLIDYLDEIYAKFGYCLNYLTEIRLLGAEGIELISKIQSYLRKNIIEEIAGLKVISKIDKWDGDPFVSDTDKYSRNVLIFNFEPPEGIESIKITVRPSGTEPKIKMYFEILSEPVGLDKLEENKEELWKLKDKLERDFMKLSYKVIDVEFPGRGFFLFWQLPLKDKLKYFEIEDQIVDLIDVESKEERQQKLNEILEFLGTNPVEKVDKAFKKKNGKGIKEYLELT